MSYPTFFPAKNRIRNYLCKLFIRGDSPTTDSSLFNKVVTNTGGVISVPAPGGHPYARSGGYFQTTSDYLSLANCPDFNLSSGSFTIRFWTYLQDLSAARVMFAKYMQNSPWTGYYFCVNTDGSGGVSTNSNTSGAVAPSGTFVPNKWYFVQLSSDGTTMTLYVNGVQKASYTGVLQEYNTSLTIGAAYTYALNGYLVDFEIAKGISRANTVPTAPIVADSYTTLHLPFQGVKGGQGIVRETAQNRIPTVGSTLALKQQSYLPFTNVAGVFNGTTDYLSTFNASDVVFSISDFTIQGWFYSPSSADWCGLISQDYYTIGINNNWSVLLNNSTGQIRFARYDGQSNGQSLTGTFATNIGCWTHIVVCRSSGTTTLYVNGTSIASTTSITSGVGSGGSIKIGWDNTNAKFCGYLAEWEVSSIARYTSNFVPQTTPFIADANTKLLLHMDTVGTTFTDSSPSPKTITTNGNAKQVVYWPGLEKVFNYNGTSTCGINLSNSTDFQFGSGDFTMEGWFLCNTNSTDQSFFSLRTGSSYGAYILYNQSGSIRFFSSSNNTSWDIASNFSIATCPINRMFHLAVSRSDSNIRFYIDGNYVTKITTTSSLYADGNNLGVGINSDNSLVPLNGNIGWIHIVKGTALYTPETVNAFAPPVAPIPCANTKAIIVPGSSSTLFMDRSSQTSPKLITVNGAAKQTLLPAGNKALSFSGSNYLSAANSSDFNLGTQDFTIHGWFLNPTANTTAKLLVGSANTSGYGFGLYLDASTANTINVALSSNGTTWDIANNIYGTYQAATWNHLALVRMGTTFILFLSGVIIGTFSSSSLIYFPVNVLTLGALFKSSATLYLPSGALMQGWEVVKGRALWTKPFNPPVR